jgi:hypothetical protein
VKYAIGIVALALVLAGTAFGASQSRELHRNGIYCHLDVDSTEICMLTAGHGYIASFHREFVMVQIGLRRVFLRYQPRFKKIKIHCWFDGSENCLLSNGQGYGLIFNRDFVVVQNARGHAVFTRHQP